MAAPTTAACVKKALANPEPSTHGPHERETLPPLPADTTEVACVRAAHPAPLREEMPASRVITTPLV
jgi:hypothetical protein